jgi:signal peptidase I
MTGQTQNAQNFAGFWPRLGSVATDWLILALALTLGNFLVMQVVHTSMSTNAFLQFFLYFLLPFSILVQILYFTWLNAGGRQSLGKKFFGIAVVNSSLLSVIAFILLIAIPAREILRSQIQAFRIPTGSLKPTLLIGDFILVDKHWAKTSAPERGDLIVFRHPQSPDLSYIERCVALPGETIEIRNGSVWVNGGEETLKLLTKEYDPEEGQYVLEYEATWREGKPYRVRHYAGHDLQLENFDAIVIPQDHYFVLGDNRDNSSDSRYWGFVPRKNILGKAGIIYWSWDSDVPLYNWKKKIRWPRIGEVLQ